jgi:hypothetical protein
VKINHEAHEGHQEFAISTAVGERDSTPA